MGLRLLSLESESGQSAMVRVKEPPAKESCFQSAR